MSEIGHLNDVLISRLAREIARDMRPLNQILESYRLDAEGFDQVADDRFFQTRLAEETALWNAPDALSISQRIKTKAATIVEDCLLEALVLIHDKNQPMSAKVEMLKWAARMAGLGENAHVQGSAEDRQVKITINIGDKRLEFDKQKPELPGRVTDVVDLTPEEAR